MPLRASIPVYCLYSLSNLVSISSLGEDSQRCRPGPIELIEGAPRVLKDRLALISLITRVGFAQSIDIYFCDTKRLLVSLNSASQQLLLL